LSKYKDKEAPYKGKPSIDGVRFLKYGLRKIDNSFLERQAIGEF
jgi:hypothetical protein